MAIWPEATTVEQQIFLLCIYGYFIFCGSKLLAEGSDILRDIYGAGLVGGIVIPIVGAIPDGLIVLFSGIKAGTHEEIQNQLTVGVGALAGATIMLITVPLCIAVFLGSRQLDEEGKAMSEYRPVAKGSSKLVLKPVLPERFSLIANGVTALPSTQKGVVWMISTCVTFLFIQIPAFFYSTDEDGGATHESIFALVGCGASAIMFFAYLYAMWDDADNLDLIEERRQRVHKFMIWSQQNRSLIGTIDPVTLFNLLDKDRDALLDVEDLRLGFKTMGLSLSHSEAQAFFNMMDVDGNAAVDLSEFVTFVREFILSSEANASVSLNSDTASTTSQTHTTPVVAIKEHVLREQRIRRNSQSQASDLSVNSSAIKDTQEGSIYVSSHNDSEIQTSMYGENTWEGGLLKVSPGDKDDPSDDITPTNAIKSNSKNNERQTLLSPGVKASSIQVRGPLQRPSYGSVNNRNNSIPGHAYPYPGAGLPNSTSAVWGLASSNPSRDRALSIASSASKAPFSYAHLESTSTVGVGVHFPSIQHPDEVVDLFTDPNRLEEPIEKNSPAPPLPPELMQLVIKWFCDNEAQYSVLIRVGTKHRWALHLWAARTGRLMHYSTTDPYTNERVLKLSKMPTNNSSTITTSSLRSGTASIAGVGQGTPHSLLHSDARTLSRNASNDPYVVNSLNRTNSSNYPSHSLTINELENNDAPVPVTHSSDLSLGRLGAFERAWTATDLPRWASASDKITEFVRQRPGCSIQTLFAEADSDKKGVVSLANLLSFCARFDLNIPAHAVKIFFFTNDADHDRALAVTDFKHFLESLVHVPEGLEVADRLMREAEDEALQEELFLSGVYAHDPAHAHMQGWSERRKKIYGISMIIIGISIVAFFSDPMIEVIGHFSHNINVNPFYVSFVITPFVSNASEVIASLMFARAKTNVSMGLTLSSLYGAVIMNNTFCMCIFFAIIAFRQLAWTFTAEVLTIITVEAIVSIIAMRETLRQWQALVIGSLFPLSIVMVYVLEEVLHVNG